MFKLKYQYDRNSTRLVVEGLPDKSIGQSSETIGIISSWTLDLVGSPTLEGKKEHLNNLIKVLLPYARYYLSGVYESFGDEEGPVYVTPISNKHRLLLISSQKGLEPLEIILDHAELADLVNCLDSLLLDKRVMGDWDNPIYQPIKKDFLSSKNLPTHTIIASILGAISLLFVSSLLLILSPQKTNRNNKEISYSDNTTIIYMDKYYV